VFIIDLHYTAPLDKVDEFLSAHVEYLNTYLATGEFLTAGRKNPRDGGIILANLPDRARAEEISATDPFVTGGVATVTITEFQAGRGKPEILNLLT
jgi:uncharacterized protein YciI